MVYSLHIVINPSATTTNSVWKLTTSTHFNSCGSWDQLPCSRKGKGTPALCSLCTTLLWLQETIWKRWSTTAASCSSEKIYTFPLWLSQSRNGLTENQKLILKQNKSGGNTMEVQRGQNSEGRTLQVLMLDDPSDRYLSEQEQRLQHSFLSAMGCVDSVCHEYHTQSLFPSPKRTHLSRFSQFSVFPHRSHTDGND